MPNIPPGSFTDEPLPRICLEIDLTEGSGQFFVVFNDRTVMVFENTAEFKHLHYELYNHGYSVLWFCNSQNAIGV